MTGPPAAPSSAESSWRRHSAAASSGVVRSVSPMQRTGARPLRSAAEVFSATTSSVSPKRRATLRVADLDDRDADLGELDAADLAGERSRVLGREVLCADEHAACPRERRPLARAAGSPE